MEYFKKQPGKDWVWRLSHTGNKGIGPDHARLVHKTNKGVGILLAMGIKNRRNFKF